MKAKIVDGWPKDNSIRIHLSDTNAAQVNSLRRAMMADVPKMAITKVRFEQGSSLDNDGVIYESVLIWGTDKYAIIYTAILQTALLFFMLKLFSANSKSDFYYLSQLNKIIMLLGICSIPLFTCFYLQ